MNVINNNSIDAKAEDLKLFLLLAEIIQKYPCCYKEKYPSSCNHRTCGKWHSISKVVKLKPASCRRRWKTLRKHFCRGLLTNRRLIDELKFLNECDPSKTPSSRLMSDPQVIENNTSKIGEMGNEENAKSALHIKTNGGYDSDLEIIEPYLETIEIVDDYENGPVTSKYSSLKLEKNDCINLDDF